MELSRELIFPEKRYKVQGGAFPKEDRFMESKAGSSVTASLDYSPNYDVKYKRTAGVIIKKDENAEMIKKKKKEKLRMMLPELTTSEKLNISLLTAASETSNLGPGSYSVNYNAVEIVKNVGLSKASRFETSKKDESLGLNLCYEQVEPKLKGAFLKPPTIMNSKLMRKRLKEKEQEESRARFELNYLQEKEKKEKQPPKQAVQVREKTEKERLMDLFRLVKSVKAVGSSRNFEAGTRDLRGQEGERRYLSH